MILIYVLKNVKKVLLEVFKSLYNFGVLLEGMLLKPNMITPWCLL